jgi:hypothetical protein
MISSGRRAQLTKPTSVHAARNRSASAVIDIIGVTPEPAEMNRYLAAGMAVQREIAERPKALTCDAGFQVVEHPARADAARLRLDRHAIENGRDGEDDSV